MDDTNIRLTLKLHIADGVGSVTFGRLMEAFGSIEGFWNAGPSAWRRVRGVGPKMIEAIGSVTDDDVQEELEIAEQRGVRIYTERDPDYPAALRSIYDPPRLLYVRGSLEPADTVSLGVVGARRCTHYGHEQASRFGQLLGRAGFTVISGGARGIDTAAHRGALTVGGRTIAVMGCGLAAEYPPENRKLFDRIVDEGAGAIVSELPMRTAVKAGNFPTRNRVISGLSLGLLVIEAARRSGSLITASTASEQGRTVFALPGRVDSSLSSGTNELIRKGVTLVQNLDDILEELGDVGESLREVEEEPDEPALPPGLEEAEKTMLLAMENDPVGLDDLVRRTRVPSGKAAAIMTMLVLKGLVEQKPGNVFARKRHG